MHSTAGRAVFQPLPTDEFGGIASSVFRPEGRIK